MFQSVSRINFKNSLECYLFLIQRSLEDLGIPNNRKGFVEARHVRPDPIIIGHPYVQKVAKFLSRILPLRKFGPNLEDIVTMANNVNKVWFGKITKIKAISRDIDKSNRMLKRNPKNNQS